MKKIDFILVITVFALTLFGIMMIYNASSIIAFRDFNDKYHYFREQSQWMVLGYLSLIFFSLLNYRYLLTAALPILLVAIVLLVGVFVPGLSVYSLGAHRWINLGFFGLQPAEFVKLSLAIYLSAWFSTKEKGRFTAFLVLIGMVLFLVMLQPDMGTASVILFEALVVYYLSGGSIIHFLILTPVLAAGGLIMTVLAPYRAARLSALFNIGKSLESTSYHVKQILIALGSGGLLGVGLGNSLQKYEYLPENVTDSIFAIIAEELGFLGSLVIMVLYLIIIWRGFIIAQQAKDTFGKLLAGAIISFLGIQVVINLAAMTALIPLTGIPLPFISYGGSALVVDLTAVGILLNISAKKTHN